MPSWSDPRLDYILSLNQENQPYVFYDGRQDMLVVSELRNLDNAIDKAVRLHYSSYKRFYELHGTSHAHRFESWEGRVIREVGLMLQRRAELCFTHNEGLPCNKVLGNDHLGVEIMKWAWLDAMENEDLTMGVSDVGMKRSLKSVIGFASVCRKWRMLATGYSLFWSRLSLTPKRHYDFRDREGLNWEKLVEFDSCIEYSRTAALDLYVVGGCRWGDLEGEIVNRIVNLAPRIRRLHLSVVQGNHELWGRMQGDFNSLEALSVASNVDTPLQLRYPPFLQFDRVTSITSPSRQASALSPETLASLTIIHLTDTTWIEIRSILQNAPALQTVSVVVWENRGFELLREKSLYRNSDGQLVVFTPVGLHDNYEVVHPYIHTGVTSFSYNAADILCTVTFPNLAQLSLLEDNSDTREFLVRSQCQLECVLVKRSAVLAAIWPGMHSVRRVILECYSSWHVSGELYHIMQTPNLQRYFEDISVFVIRMDSDGHWRRAGIAYQTNNLLPDLLAVADSRSYLSDTRLAWRVYIDTLEPLDESILAVDASILREIETNSALGRAFFYLNGQQICTSSVPYSFTPPPTTMFPNLRDVLLFFYIRFVHWFRWKLLGARRPGPEPSSENEIGSPPWGTIETDQHGASSWGAGDWSQGQTEGWFDTEWDEQQDDGVRW